MVRIPADHLDNKDRFRPSIDITPSFNLTADNRAVERWSNGIAHETNEEIEFSTGLSQGFGPRIGSAGRGHFGVVVSDGTQRSFIRRVPRRGRKATTIRHRRLVHELKTAVYFRKT